MEAIPANVLAAANAKSRRLRELVLAPEVLVMPGAWDVLSAVLFEHLGFAAVQCSSSAIAAVLGYPDGEVIGRDRTVGATRDIAAAVAVPVNADGEAGYGGPEAIGETVRALVAAGAAGMNLEDTIAGTRTLVEVPAQLEKIAAFVDAKRQLGSEFFLNARVDAFAAMANDAQDALAEAVRRGNAYAEAGADCIFFLNAVSRDQIATLVKEVRAPVSVFAVAATPPVAELQEMGVARVSYGSAFLRVALGGLVRFCVELRERRTHTALQDAMPGAELQRILRERLPTGRKPN